MTSAVVIHLTRFNEIIFGYTLVRRGELELLEANNDLICSLEREGGWCSE